MILNNLNQHYILTADIGGSHITSGICDMQTYDILDESITRLDVICQGVADDILSTWVNAIQKTMQKTKVKISGLTLAMPGPFDYENGISYIKGVNKYDSLYGIDVKKHLSDKLGLNPAFIKFRNDAEAILVGEVLNGAGAGTHIGSAIGLTLGTGFGSAYFNPMETIDLNLYCISYKNSIADDYFSTRWFQKEYLRLSGKQVSGLKELIETEQNLEILAKLFIDFTENLSEFMDEHLHRLQPDVLILGGNIAKAADYFLPLLEKNLGYMAIKIATLGENAALVGAASLLKKNNQMVVKS